MEVHKALPLCINNGLKVYPIHKKGMMYVAVSKDDGIPKVGTIAHTQKSINKAITETIIYLAQKLEG